MNIIVFGPTTSVSSTTHWCVLQSARDTTFSINDITLDVTYDTVSISNIDVMFMSFYIKMGKNCWKNGLGGTGFLLNVPLRKSHVITYKMSDHYVAYNFDCMTMSLKSDIFGFHRHKDILQKISI